MNFFIPYAQSPEQAEQVWSAVRRFLADQECPTEERRIRKVAFRHNGQDYRLEVGAMHPDLAEEVLLILRASDRPLYYACTPNRGVLRGTPYLVGIHEGTRAVDFS